MTTRALSADLATAHAKEPSRSLGTLNAADFSEVLARLAAFNPALLDDAEPELVVTARRGRFIVQPGRGKLLLRSANDPEQAYVELPAGDVPAFLDNPEYVAAPPPDHPDAPPKVADLPAPAAPRKSAFAFALLAGALALLAGSAYVTYRPNPVDSPAQYVAVADPSQLSLLRQQVVGTFATQGDERSLAIGSDGIVRYRENSPDPANVYERKATYAVAMRRDSTNPVLRTSEIGPIEIRGPHTLFYAGETYTRNPDTGGPLR